MKRCLQNIVVLLSVSINAGCATIINRDSGRVDVDSLPDGATIFIDGAQQDETTPALLRLDSAVHHRVEVKKDGFRDRRVFVDRHMHWSAWLNLVLGLYGLIGFAVDYYSGSLWTLDPDVVKVKLKPIDEAPAANAEDESASPSPEPAASPPPIADSLPNDAFMNEIREKFPEDEVRIQIEYYYEAKDRAEIATVRDRIYRILYDLRKKGEKLDIDQAIRMDLANQGL